MADIETVVNQAISDFDNIEAAIKEMGVDVPIGTDTSEYGDKIRSIERKAGQDGFSPIATVTPTDNGAKISITDINGTTEATIRNGVDGVNGKDGENGKDGVDGKDGYTPQKGIDYFDGTNGKDGKDGTNGLDGKDGYTPIKGVDYFTETDKAELIAEIENSVVGDIDTALDELHAYAQALVTGGES